MATLEELLKRPRTFRILVALAKEGPMNMRRFIEASQQSQPQAKLIRDALEDIGLVEVREQGGHGTIGVLEIRLTPLGQKLGEHLLAMEKLLHSATERRK